MLTRFGRATLNEYVVDKDSGEIVGVSSEAFYCIGPNPSRWTSVTSANAVNKSFQWESALPPEVQRIPGNSRCAQMDGHSQTCEILVVLAQASSNIAEIALSSIDMTRNKKLLAEMTIIRYELQNPRAPSSLHLDQAENGNRALRAGRHTTVTVTTTWSSPTMIQ